MAVSLRSLMLPFLAPAPPPSQAFVRSFLRRAQSTAAYTSSREDPNLVASRTASRSYPPASFKSQPRPKQSRSSQRTSQPTRVKSYPDRVAPQTPLVRVELTERDCAPNLPYFVTRTPSNELPVYHLSKAGGNKELTRIRRIDGNPQALRDQLQSHLGLKAEDCVVNQLTRQVILRGHVKQQVEAFLMARKF